MAKEITLKFNASDLDKMLAILNEAEEIEWDSEEFYPFIAALKLQIAF